MNSRKFLAFMLALVMVISMVTGCSTQTDGEPDENTIMNYDVIVVGGGAAGLSAAIEAADAGAKVALLEKMPVVGGSTLTSEGIVYATGSQIQKDYNVNDSTETLVNFWIDKAEGQVEVPFLQLAADTSGATIDWLIKLGVSFGEPTATGISPVLRAHTPDEKGAGIIEALLKEAESKKVTVYLETSATELIINENNEVTGVKALDKDGIDLTFTATSIILATGGFDKNSELIETYAPIAKGQTSFASEGNTGDGLTMALAIGADLVLKGGVIGTKTALGELTYDSEVNQLLSLPYLSVNVKGERFVDESLAYSLYYDALVKQETPVSYMIFDATTVSPVLDQAIENGSAFAADTLDELSKLAGIDAVGLTATVNFYNDMIKYGKDTQFGKDLSTITPIESPKYYALKVVPAILGTMSGLKINPDTQVLNKEGKAITGLYAAGELASGDFYNTIYPADGSSLLFSLTFGRIAGTNAADFANK